MKLEKKTTQTYKTDQVFEKYNMTKSNREPD